MWLIGAMVCLLAAPWVQLSVSAGNGWPHNALWHHWLMPISCHFRDCKALLVTNLTPISGVIASVQTFFQNYKAKTSRATVGPELPFRHAIVSVAEWNQSEPRRGRRVSETTVKRRCANGSRVVSPHTHVRGLAPSSFRFSVKWPAMHFETATRTGPAARTSTKKPGVFDN